jgi:hypothetical protein
MHLHKSIQSYSEVVVKDVWRNCFPALCISLFVCRSLAILSLAHDYGRRTSKCGVAGISGRSTRVLAYLQSRLLNDVSGHGRFGG